tara:strand:+ start:748 stop:1452 length:705 start_codon:yes stop_codon:yes gene_type:complete
MNVNISIDDVSPHPRSSTIVIDQCKKIIDQFNEAKFSLFVPISYWRTMRREVATEYPLQIDKFPDFCQELRELDPKNFEICFHGYHHGIPGKSDNDELRDIDYNSAIILIDRMREIVSNAGLSDVFKQILRPPAWRMSPDCFKACKDKGIEILALTDLDYAVKTYGKKDLTYEKVTYANIFPPHRPLRKENNALIVYHACDWDKNYLNEKHCNDLIQFLKDCSDNIEFCFMDEI